MLSREMHWSFVFGVVVVYGISQGVGGALAGVGTKYYMKDVQKVQPSEAQVYAGITSIPWIVKPLWGLLTDVLPIFGYRRRPYFIFAELSEEDRGTHSGGSVEGVLRALDVTGVEKGVPAENTLTPKPIDVALQL
ncbi:putative folate-biopterin transporter 2-like protein [Trifolium pratense]|uniref:Putative folate-biopterin transporter 2-like protein n=1 Tax=Trifolium pratense TaxID=57577 RepID=A0A2K3LJL9_TRIPR|nr:putative folate-biopterin transporter 2-like protein [Trifolium pratense]